MLKSNGVENLDSEDWGDIFDDTQEDEAQLLKKDKETSQEQLAKESVFYLYDNIANLKDGEEIDVNLVGLIPEGEQITKKLKAIKKADLMPVFDDYMTIKEGEDPQAVEMAKIFIANDKKNKELIDLLEKVSKSLNIDIIKDIWQRDRLEKRASKMIDFMNKTQYLKNPETGELEPMRMENVQLFYSDTLGELIDEDNQNYLKGKPLKNPEITERMIEERFKNIKPKIDQIIDWELDSLENKKFEYKKMDDEQLVKFKKQLEEFKKLDIKNFFDKKNLSFMGQLLEQRLKYYNRIQERFDSINEQIGQYFP